MDIIEMNYADMVARLAKPGDAIRQEMTAEQAHLLHMAVGVAGEAGELLDAIKKHVIYQKPIDVENITEELGDLEFFLEGVRAALGISRLETLQANIDKLSKKRYPNGYSNEAAQARADKQ